VQPRFQSLVFRLEILILCPQFCHSFAILQFLDLSLKLCNLLLGPSPDRTLRIPIVGSFPLKSLMGQLGYAS
jgi:hypothetical protein